MKSDKNVRTPPPDGQFGGRLLPCGAIPSRENYINQWAPGYYQASLFTAPGHFIGTLRLEVSWSALSKANMFTIHSRRAKGVLFFETQLSTHDSFKLLFSNRSNIYSSWIHSPPGSRNCKPTSSSPKHYLRRLPFCSAIIDSTPPSDS
jgi:hypothetical protein